MCVIVMKEILNSEGLTYEGLSLFLLRRIMETRAAKRVKILQKYHNLGDNIYVVGRLKKDEALFAMQASYFDLYNNFQNMINLKDVYLNGDGPCEFTKKLLRDESTLGLVPVINGLEECLLIRIHCGISSVSAEPITSSEGLIYHPALYLKHDLSPNLLN